MIRLPKKIRCFLNKDYIELGIGTYISLYGNRTITATDSLSDVTRTSKIVRASDTTAIYYNERANRISSYYSDNLGAYFSPLVNLGKWSAKENNLRIYYAPSAEFIWRRTNLNISYSGKTPTDTIVKNEQVIGEIIAPNKFSTSFNQYQFNMGYLGFFLAHENKHISIRLYCAIGHCSKYIHAASATTPFLYDVPYRKQQDVFFSGRLWATEPVSGITLQAEITNTFKNPTPYYGVTLSKAIHFQHLGSIFSPISSR